MNTSGNHDQETWPPPTGEAAIKSHDRGPQSWVAALVAAPLEVILFAVFAIAATAGDVWLTFLGPKLWRETVYPYIGGTGINPTGSVSILPAR